jgi:hypothetical protein
MALSNRFLMAGLKNMCREETITLQEILGKLIDDLNLLNGHNQ